MLHFLIKRTQNSSCLKKFSPLAMSKKSPGDSEVLPGLRSPHCCFPLPWSQAEGDSLVRICAQDFKVEPACWQRQLWPTAELE